MHSAWPVWLFLALVVPPAARWLGRGPARPSRLRRAGVHLLHLSALAACALLAAQAGGPRAGHPGWDRSSVLVTLLGGLLWVEGALLVGKRAASGGVGREWSSRKPAGSGSAPTGLVEAPSRAARSEETPADGQTGAGAAPLPREARALLERIQQLDRVAVEEIMTPRERIVLADSAEPLASTLRRMRLSGRSRLPVAAGSPDRILGVLHAKDLVPLALREERAASLRRHLRRYLHVPQGHSVARLLEDFRQHRVHIGIVTDSMGTTLGLVTMTDVFRFIAGSSESGERTQRTEGP